MKNIIKTIIAIYLAALWCNQLFADPNNGTFTGPMQIKGRATNYLFVRSNSQSGLFIIGAYKEISAFEISYDNTKNSDTAGMFRVVYNGITFCFPKNIIIYTSSNSFGFYIIPYSLSKDQEAMPSKELLKYMESRLIPQLLKKALGEAESTPHASTTQSQP